MMPDQLAPYAEQHPAAPAGWEPLATLPITAHRLPIEYLCENKWDTRQTLGVSNLDFVCFRPPIAWRPLKEGPLHDWYWAEKERRANTVAAYD